jgi:ubiquinone/menaquinone biosynthesis C-methylase UbiE
MTFWDFCATFYDRAEHTNTAYVGMLELIRDLTPENADVFEAAAGTDSISLAVADKAKRVLCTDLSRRMLKVARRKAQMRGAGNITFGTRSLFDTLEADGAFDTVIAGQALHLIDEPPMAVAVWRKTI